MRMPLTTVIWQNVLSAVQRNPAGDIRAGLHTLLAQVNALIAGIRAHTVFRMERVQNVAILVHTAIPKRYIPTKMFQQDITSTVTLQAVIPAAKP